MIPGLPKSQGFRKSHLAVLSFASSSPCQCQCPLVVRRFWFVSNLLNLLEQIIIRSYVYWQTDGHCVLFVISKNLKFSKSGACHCVVLLVFNIQTHWYYATLSGF